MPTSTPDPPEDKDSADVIVPRDAAGRSFVEGLIARGQAARADASGKLPPRATHEIIGETADGFPILRRRRMI
jgi:hypothetical protein